MGWRRPPAPQGRYRLVADAQVRLVPLELIDGVGPLGAIGAEAEEEWHGVKRSGRLFCRGGLRGIEIDCSSELGQPCIPPATAGL